jgi:molybdopterin-guanine dinucleotide biosynthesis protein A
MATTLGVLLAGGRGERLGAGVPKALVPCAGRTLLERAHAVLAAVCDVVVVVAPGVMDLPVAAADRVDDPPGRGGPLPALVAGLRARVHDEAFVLAVDLPLMEVAALARLRDRGFDAQAVVPRPGGVAQPLAAWYSGRARDLLAIEAEAGERSVTAAVGILSPLWVDDVELVTWPGGREAWMNVNTRAELAVAEERLLAEQR